MSSLTDIQGYGELIQYWNVYETYGLLCAGPEYDYNLQVKIQIPQKDWNSNFKKNGIGQLNVDVCNTLYRSIGYGAYNPTVSGLKDRCKGGFKTLTFIFYFGSKAEFERLNILKATKSGFAPKLTLVRGAK